MNFNPWHSVEISTRRAIPPHFYSELRHFFQKYKKLENKTVLVEDFQGKQTAIDIIEKAIAALR